MELTPAAIPIVAPPAPLVSTHLSAKGGAAAATASPAGGISGTVSSIAGNSDSGTTPVKLHANPKPTLPVLAIPIPTPYLAVPHHSPAATPRLPLSAGAANGRPPQPPPLHPPPHSLQPLYCYPSPNPHYQPVLGGGVAASAAAAIAAAPYGYWLVPAAPPPLAHESDALNSGNGAVRRVQSVNDFQHHRTTLVGAATPMAPLLPGSARQSMPTPQFHPPASAGATLRHSASAASVPPLPLASMLPPSMTLPLSLAGGSMPIGVLAEKLREMQYEVSRLNRKFRTMESDAEIWSLRYSRRLVILSNLMLGFWMFFIRFARTVRQRKRIGGLLGRLLRTAQPTAASAPGARAAAAAASTSMSEVLLSGALSGFAGSAIFFYCVWFHFRPQAWKRNLSFILSCTYSVYLAASSADNPRASNYFNVFFNFLYAFARYYHLHGLLVFRAMRLL